MTEGREKIRKRRRSQSEIERLVSEYEQSGMGRKEFCAAQGLSVHTLDAWRQRVARSVSAEKLVPVELVERGGQGLDFATKLAAGLLTRKTARQDGQLRVVLSGDIRIEVDPGFNASELRRLITVLGAMGSVEPSAV